MRNHIEALASNAIFAIAGLASFMLLSRNCPPSLFGEWVLFLSLSTFVDLVRFGLTRNAVIRLIASAKEEREGHLVNASGLRAGIAILAIITLLFYLTAFIGKSFIGEIYIRFLVWYPAVGLSNILWNNALSWLQARSKFRSVIWLRGTNIGLFIVGIALLIYTKRLSFDYILAVYLLSNIISSVYGLVRGWDSARYIGHSDRREIREILSFGKYSVGATLGSSLLKSADSFIISLSPILGVTGVAIYAIPFKLVEMLELPIRSISMVGYNHFSATVLNHREGELRQLTARYILLMALTTLPVIIVVSLFPDMILRILGGNGYADHMEQMRIMLYILILYGIFLIPDRITGITLEALGQPKMNMYKVLLMAFFNILGDLIAVFVFHSLIGVVIATVIFVIIGVSVGYLLIPQQLRPQVTDLSIQSRLLGTQLWTILSQYLTKRSDRAK